MIRILPTASHTDTFLNCPWPWDKSLEESQVPRVGEGANYGVLFHAIQAAPSKERVAIAANWPDPKGILAAAKEARVALNAWLDGHNSWGLHLGSNDGSSPSALRFREHAFKLMLKGPRVSEASSCDKPSEDTHEYPEHVLGEMRGTADYVLVDSHTRTLVVLDWKTGFASTYDIAGHGQLRTLSLMALQRFVLKHFQPKWRVILAIGEARQGCTAQIVAEEVPVSMLTEEHLNNLVAAQERVGLGFLRPGEVQCQWCPARGICPVEAGKTTTQTKAIVLAAGGLLKKVRKSEEGITASNAGQLHQVVQGLRKLTDQCQSSIKDLVRTSGIITRPDGKVLVIKSHPVETLSKESIRRGLGAERAKALLEELRGMGAMEVSEREVLVAVDNE